MFVISNSFVLFVSLGSVYLADTQANLFHKMSRLKQNYWCENWNGGLHNHFAAVHT